MFILADDGREDITDWFYNSTDNVLAELNINDVTFRRVDDSIFISFPSG